MGEFFLFVFFFLHQIVSISTKVCSRNMNVFGSLDFLQKPEMISRHK